MKSLILTQGLKQINTTKRKMNEAIILPNIPTKNDSMASVKGWLLAAKDSVFNYLFRNS